ncbi:M81 family metallopeptidase [Paracoccus onubensis]|uniref:M81 family metallopeptidase n=1 Tax=Paracoccus onubensis TaxID=1675788 RepID=UPI002730E6AD|nr:M81 family metallopeptidase [Paracoccus onubensis]MDP0927131.1 M81 family metallopeptidase [Paracoccus onubensis]
MSKRIAVGGFLHETNTFAPTKAALADFERGGGSGPIARGKEIFSRSGKSNQGIMGAIDHARAQGWDIVPTIWCAASPSAHTTEEAFETVSGEMIERIASALPLDGIYLDLHGAMVCEHLDDGEGELLKRLRACVGEVPIVVSLDLHANVTPLMVEMADVLDSYRTYPHVDMFTTGKRCGEILGRLMNGEKNEKAYLQAPFLTAISWQSTDENPAKGLYAEVARLAEGLLSVSFNMGFPAADFPDCGMSVTAYGTGAGEAAQALMDRVMAAEPAFVGEVLTPDEAVAKARLLAGDMPVIIADTQDNPGAGGDANTTGMLHALIRAEARNALIGGIYDPEAALAAHAAGVGATIRLSLGGQSGGDAPVEAEFIVEAVSDGKFLAKGPYYGVGPMNLGPCAALRIGDVRICVISLKAQMAEREMFRHLGLIPEQARVIVVKSSVHFRADFAPIASAILVAAAPGPMAVDPASLPWKRLRKGLRLSPLGDAFGERDRHLAR